MWWLAGLLAAQQVAGSVAPGSREFDMQCLLVTQQAADEIQDKEVASITQMATMFFMGRVDVATPHAQLAAAVEQAEKEMKGKPLSPHLRACGEFMQQRGKVFERVGAELIAQKERESTP